MIEEPTTPLDGGPSACPFVAFEDDRDHRSSSPDYRHRCFAAPEPEPRAFPHQELYCLSADFPRCPVFLDWACQEAAGVKVGGAAVAGAAIAGAIEADDAAAAGAVDGGAAPAFLAARPRTSPNADELTSSRRKADASAGLWSYESETKRSPAPAAPVPPSSLGPPAVAMARRGPSHPGWENPPRVETFPRLRSREDRRANQPLLFAAIGIALFMVALVLFPIVTSSKGTTGAASGSPHASGSVLESAVPSGGDTPTPGFSFLQYKVKSGDYLAKIAAQFNLHLWELELANPLADPDHIEVGQILSIPPAGFLTPSPAPPSATPSAS